MVLVLQTYKFLVKFFGSHQSERENFKWKLITICYLVFLTPFALAPLNSHDLKKLAGAVFSSMGCLILFSFVLHYQINSVQFDLLENELQNVVDESEYEP